jgi:hypothetical protein
LRDAGFESMPFANAREKDLKELLLVLCHSTRACAVVEAIPWFPQRVRITAPAALFTLAQTYPFAAKPGRKKGSEA